MDSAFRIDVVIPVHNEGESIAATLGEFYRVFTQAGYKVRFLICEDGSSDDTPAVLKTLSGTLPIALITGNGRKGYSQAVIDGMRAVEADYAFFADGDGQCDPGSLLALLELIPQNDMVAGWRSPRRDPLFRLIISGAFKVVYQLLFPVRLHDPSCPYVLIRKDALQRLRQQKLGLLNQGLWWEFNARAQAIGLRTVQAPIRHRARAAGKTQIYRLLKLPRIAAEHLIALFRLRRELGKIRTRCDNA